ncbi:MAG: DegV family protein [Thermoflexales bacterium]|nr:DegV family protein [Thermoflexales bacterium]
MKIVTDSAVDLPEEMFAQFGIERMPLLISFGKEMLRSGIDIGPEEFYKRLAASGDNIPTTSQPSPGEFADLYRKVGAVDKDILSIHISSGLSGTLNAAVQGAKQCPELNITHVDTKTLSAAEGFQVVAAAQGLRRGWPLDKILARIQQVADQTEIFFTLDTLHYLQKGGRIGRVQAMAGALLNLKPVITVDKGPGTYVTVVKGRSMAKSVALIADQVAEKMKQTPAWVHVLHTNSPDMAKQQGDLIRAKLPNAHVTFGQIVPVLGVHTGPGCVGAVCGPVDLLAE